MLIPPHTKAGWLGHSLIRNLWLISLWVGSVSQSAGEQLSFDKVNQRAETEFSYQWHDTQGQVQQLRFALPSVSTNRQNHKRFVDELAQQYVYIALLREARKVDPREATIQVFRKPQTIDIKVTSRSQEALQKWQDKMRESQQQALQDYLSDNYYSQFTSYLGEQAIKPAHLRYINENREALLPVAQAIYAKLPPHSESRLYVNLLLSWVQSIPYNTLEDRVSSNGAGFLPPLSVIASNQGDCDSKSVLMASLVRSLLPDVNMVMVYLPQHALLGISLPTRSSEPTFNIDGIEYLLMEPTGPALLPLGSIAPSSSADLAANHYSYEIIP